MYKIYRIAKHAELANLALELLEDALRNAPEIEVGYGQQVTDARSMIGRLMERIDADPEKAADDRGDLLSVMQRNDND